MEMMQTLKSKDVTFVNPHEVPICQEKGIPVLDVRTVDQYDKVTLFLFLALADCQTFVALFLSPCLHDVASIFSLVHRSFERETQSFLLVLHGLRRHVSSCLLSLMDSRHDAGFSKVAE